MKNNTIVGLDIGSTNTKVVIADANGSQELVPMGFSNVPTKGIRRGVVVNIDALLGTISDAIDIAEQMAGYEVEEVFVSIGGDHVSGINSRGIQEVEGKARHEKNEISQEDINNAILSASTVYFPSDREVLNVYPQFFTVDNISGIRNPLGMLGKRLEVDVHIITCSSVTAQNVVRAVNRAGFRVSKLYLNSVSAAEAALTKDEIDMGVLLIDMGGDTTNSILIKEDAPMFTESLRLGGKEVTGDLAYILRTSRDLAEKVKCEEGNCLDFLVEKGEPVAVPGAGGRAPLLVERKQIVEIIKPRIAEILLMIRDRVHKRGLLQNIGGGVVLVGGGALLPGVAEVAQEVFQIVARIGQPANYGGPIELYRTADYSTAIGMVQLAAREKTPKITHEVRQRSDGGATLNIKRWLRNFFE